MNTRIYTVGHSSHQTDAFIALLERYSITAVVDVRSQPYSRHNPQFNMESIQKALHEAGITYLFLGKELGARSENPECYVEGKAQYDLLAREPAFREGIDRVVSGLERYCIVLMCAEGDPLKCHRTILVGMELLKRGIELCHILPDGSLETHLNTEKRLLALLGLPESGLFRTHAEIVADAYVLQSQRIAYVGRRPSNPASKVRT